MKPILKYRGGKSKEIPAFNQYIPEFDRYIEPFFGGGAVYFNLEPKKAIINDINKPLIEFYKDVSLNFERLKNELKEIENIYTENRVLFEANKLDYPNERVEDLNEQLYYTMRDMFNGKIRTDYLFGTLYYFINKTAYSGMIRYNSSGEFNVPYGRYKNFNTDLLTIDHARLLQKSEIYNSSYRTIFNKAKNRDFIFLDPPYDTIFSSYGNEIATGDFGESEHRLLAQDFRNLDCKAMIIISETVLINELYQDYIIDKYPKRYSVNIRNRFESNANHLVITNYKIK